MPHESHQDWLFCFSCQWPSKAYSNSSGSTMHLAVCDDTGSEGHDALRPSVVSAVARPSRVLGCTDGRLAGLRFDDIRVREIKWIRPPFRCGMFQAAFAARTNRTRRGSSTTKFASAFSMRVATNSFKVRVQELRAILAFGVLSRPVIGWWRRELAFARLTS